MNNPVPEILKEKYSINSADTDFTRRIKVSSLTNMFIQSAWHHAEDLGFGIHVLHRQNCVWMLSRFRLRLLKIPSFNETISINTWPKGIHRLFYQRDFEVFAANNTEIALGTSEWLIIDLKARRPRLIDADHHIFNPGQVRHAIDEPVPVLDTPATRSEHYKRQVRYSDIDLNQHLTTTRYIDWMFDTFEPEFLKENSCTEVIVNFLREIPHNTVAEIARFNSEEVNTFCFELTNSGKKLVFFRGQLVF